MLLDHRFRQWWKAFVRAAATATFTEEDLPQDTGAFCRQAFASLHVEAKTLGLRVEACQI